MLSEYTLWMLGQVGGTKRYVASVVLSTICQCYSGAALGGERCKKQKKDRVVLRPCSNRPLLGVLWIQSQNNEPTFDRHDKQPMPNAQHNMRPNACNTLNNPEPPNRWTGMRHLGEGATEEASRGTPTPLRINTTATCTTCNVLSLLPVTAQVVYKLAQGTASTNTTTQAAVHLMHTHRAYATNTGHSASTDLTRQHL